MKKYTVCTLLLAGLAISRTTLVHAADTEKITGNAVTTTREMANDFLLLAGGALPLCSSLQQAACIGPAPLGRRDAPKQFLADARGQRLREVVDFDASRSTAAKQIYRRFVAMARAAHFKRTGHLIERPRIGVLTSSAEDPFDPVDFYLDAFAQAGGQSVWLPLDPAVRANYGTNCSGLAATREKLTGAADRSTIYPDLAQIQQRFCQDRTQLAQILAELDGLFFNGGDQTLTKATWFAADQPIAEFAQLQKRVQSRTLAIGGTSAGTAVMSAKVMITNGESPAALSRGAKASPPPPLNCARKKTCPKGLQEDDLTYDARGGLGLFALGILDTHFSARQRSGRLATLLIDSQSRFGFGVDETTALLVADALSKLRLSVIGQGAVWIFDAHGKKNAAELAIRATPLKAGQSMSWPSP
jgi:cyanophycinase